MKPTPPHFYWLCIALFCITISAFPQSDDPFQGGTPSPSPVHDAAYYEQRAKEDAEHWLVQLKALGQPDISKSASKPEFELFRFTYSPHFSKPLVITVSRDRDRITFAVNRYSEKGTLELSGQINTDKDTYEFIRETFVNPQVIDPLRGITPAQRDHLWGLDGSWWHVETLLNGRYTHAIVWSPESITEISDEKKAHFKKLCGFTMPDLKPFESACLLLVKLAGLPLDATNYEPRGQSR